MAGRLICIVEGQGDVLSVPLIVRRLLQRQSRLDVTVPRPIRVQRYSVIRPGELERAVELAAREAGKAGGVLVVLDADDDLPCELAPLLLGRATAAQSNIATGIVLARSEKEAWFIASIESLRGLRGIPVDAIAPQDPEGIRGAKSWIARLRGGPYSEITDQPALASKFDLELAQGRSASFAKFVRELERIVATIPVG